ncbi:hypothetical protein TrRE_jg6569, partial [Triparma retinervis]
MYDVALEYRGLVLGGGGEIWRVTKLGPSGLKGSPPPLPRASKFARNDIVALTKTGGPGDYWETPLSDGAVRAEGVVSNGGPYYVDVVLKAGEVSGTFGGGEGDVFRMDRFFSDVTHARMCGAVAALTRVEDGEDGGEGKIDKVIRDTILLSYAKEDGELGRGARESAGGKLDVLSKLIAKSPPQYTQPFLTAAYSTATSGRSFNNPQLTSIAAALTRRLTIIVGPPGTGKTTTGAAIALGASSLQRSVDPSGNSKVLCCAFSNAGADNFAEKLIDSGLTVVRVGRSTAMDPGVVKHSLDWHVDRDAGAQAALKAAALATSRLKSTDRNRERSARSEATLAVQRSIDECQRAAYDALKGCDVVVTTCVGAVDPRLMASLGRGGEEGDGRWRPTANLKL